MKYEYIVAFDGLGNVELFKVKENELEDFLEELQSESKIFAVVANKINKNKLCLEAHEITTRKD